MVGLRFYSGQESFGQSSGVSFGRKKSFGLSREVHIKEKEMNREMAENILRSYGRPVVLVGKTRVIFDRQSEGNIEEIEKKSDEDLIESWKGLMSAISFLGQYSLNDLQRMDLLDLEVESRESIDIEELDMWLVKRRAEHDANYDLKGDKE